ncbi:MAG TPA: SDR family NAD(P)-dependent oxidoreductase [Opitutaceae bacterium]|jgi:acyl transferase domain-containing protein/D-arabinose 1-dehydrogenase-like Zn-dependent alcohol dehydrogenase/acyl carrier protein
MVASSADSIDTAKAVAVIGMQLRYPGATSVRQFWTNLLGSAETISYFTEDELAAVGIPREAARAPGFVAANPEIGDIAAFEPAFFGFNQREAEIIDPQVRILLETCWQALEDAGYDPERYRGRIGVFAGANLSKYFMHNLLPQAALLTEHMGSISSLSMFNDRDALATIVSYKLNLRGPGVTVQTYCSTSLVAVHLGCQSILCGDSDMVLAGGVSLNGEGAGGYMYEEGSILSKDGHCRPFDAQASGTVFGNGVGMVVLKRLDRAIADGDTIHAAIRGSAINNDGSVKAGFLAPSVQGQVESITSALERSGVHPESIGFVEAHGTATLVGDPIEVSALSKAFSLWTERRRFCALSSVKGNFGHLDRAAGVAGLMKAVLCVKEGVIPPTVNYTAPNPKIDFANSPFVVADKVGTWPVSGGPRRALVSSLGVGGTNAHAVIEQAPEPVPSGPSRPNYVWVVSARTAKSLEAMCVELAKHLAERPQLNLADAAYTLAIGRKAFEHRRVVIGRDASELIKILEDPNASKTAAVAARRPMVFLFPGQGAQHVNMGRGLYESEAVFRAEVDWGCDLLKPLLGFDLRTVLYPASKDQEAAATDRLKQTALAQPALFVVEYALARLWESWGVRPDAMIGHSIGEYVAAAMAGVFAPEDALALVAERGRLMQSLPRGAMLSVGCDEATATGYLDDGISLAAVNSPESCVLSGPEERIDALERTLTERGLTSRRLQTSHAFHSAMMEPILAEFTAKVAAVPRQAPKLRYISNLTGDWIQAAQATDPAYWARHLRSAVRFSDGAKTALASGTSIALEVGPGRTLSALAWQRPDVAVHGKPVTSMRHPREDISDALALAYSLGRLWSAGADIDWEAYFSGERRRRIPLPKYVFDRLRYWVQTDSAAAYGTGRAAGSTARHDDVADWFYAPQWAPATLNVPAGEGPKNWLLLGNPSPDRDALEARLRAAGHDPAIVETGFGFEKFGIGQYRVNPGTPGDFVALVDALREEGKFPQRIAHLWAAQLPSPGAALEHYETTQNRCFHSLLGLVQALGQGTFTENLHLAVVTRGLHSVAGEPVTSPERATLIGPCRVIAQEYREIYSAAVDVSGTPDEAAAAAIAELSAGPRDPVVAWRGPTRYVQRFQPRRLESAAEGVPPRLKSGGTYLITGGLGGIGLTVADWLARTAQARLVLVNRSPLPPAEEWAAWLEKHGDEDRTSRRIRSVRALQERGAAVIVLRADSAAAEDMRTAVAAAREKFGRIDGVFHSAGLPGDGVIQLKERAVAAAVIDAKVKAALILEEVLRDDPPDFLVHFSSLAAVVGGFGQVDYCGANSALDALALSSAARGVPPSLSINWDAWSEVGMAVETAVRPKLAQMFKQASAFQEIEHPIFSRVRMDGEVIHYVADISAAKCWFVSDHVLYGKPTMPGTAYLELARSAFARHADATGTYRLTDVYILAVFAIEPDETRGLHVVLTPAGDGYDFVVKSPTPHDPENWLEHCIGHIAVGSPRPAAKVDFDQIVARCNGEVIDAQASSHASPGMSVKQASHLVVGPRWLTPEWVRMGVDEGVAEQRLADHLRGDVKVHPLHPGLLDLTAFFPLKLKHGGVFIPFAHKVVHVYGPLTPRVRSHIRVVSDDGKGKFVLEAVMIDDAGNELLVMEDYTLSQIEAAASAGSGNVKSAPKTGLFPFLPEAENFQVDMSALGSLDTLAIVPSARIAPGPGEVEVQICAAGLNFKDVLRALGMLSTEHDAGLALGFGGEGAGQVVAVGSGVTELQPGDRVIVMGAKCFSGFLTVPLTACGLLDDKLSFTEGATVPLVFLTAHYALNNHARLAKGERVLIHAAAGGVGLAAVQCARRVGAEIIATAGSPAKRDYLHSLGIEHVFDSRSLSFADDVMRVTNGRGVDVVLNSLAGDFILRGLDVLAREGRFLEIGARDIYQNSQIGLRPFARNLTFTAIEMTPIMIERPQFIRELLAEIMGHFRTGAYHALPIEAYPITEVVDAFQHMAKARHIGKVVLSIAPPARLVRGGVRGGSRTAAIKEAAGEAVRGGAHEAAISPKEGVEALSRILGGGSAQVAVSVRPLATILDFFRGQKDVDPAAAETKTGSRKLYPRPALANPYMPPATETERRLAVIWQDLIGIEQVGAQDNFFELGGDSLIGVQVISRIRKDFGLQLPATSLYEGSTLEAFARAIDAQVAGSTAAAAPAPGGPAT